MPTFSPTYIEPGGYAEFKPTQSFVAIPGVIRVPAFVGKGSATKDVSGYTVERGLVAHGVDALPSHVESVSKVYQTAPLYIEYTPTTDYEWGNGLTSDAIPVPSVVNTKTLKLTVGSNPQDTVTFAGVASAANIATQINSAMTYAQAQVVETSKILVYSVSGAAYTIDDGDANTNFGFYEDETSVGYISWAPSGVNSQEPASGTNFYVDYSRQKTLAEYTPTYYFSLNDVYDDWGTPDVSGTGDSADVENKISLAAKIAFDHGSNVVLLSPVQGDTLDDYKNAIDSLENFDCTVVVPLYYSVTESWNATMRQYLKQHCIKMSTIIERRFRTGITYSSLTGRDDVRNTAIGLNSKRIVLTYPSSCKYTVDNVDVSFQGYMISAAVAGLATSIALDPAEPLTWKVLNGFSEITNPFLRTELNYIAEKGVCIIETANFAHRVRHCLTTAQSGRVDEQEYSIVETLDFVAETTRRLLESLLVGTKLVPSALSLGAGSLRSYLNTLIERAIINGVQNLSLRQNPVDPRQVDVTFQVAPVYPLNWVYITFTLSS